jgi:hypothetical protein
LGLRHSCEKNARLLIFQPVGGLSILCKGVFGLFQTTTKYYVRFFELSSIETFVAIGTFVAVESFGFH